ncbi:MAG: DnaJ family domain-containing protein [Pseudomonadota bacterium]
MAREFDLLVERQIHKAITEGQSNVLEGEGRPLPTRSSEAVADMATSVAVRIMTEAGALPEEFKLKKLLQAAKRRYARTESDEEDKRVALALISDLETRYNIAVEARGEFMDR